MTIPEYPITREEMYLDAIARGGGGGEAVLVNKTVSANGTYLPSADSADGYKKVVVNVPTPTPALTTKTVTANGTYAAADDGADGYSSVTVDVPVGETVYYNRYGAQYTKNMSIPVSNGGAFPQYQYCDLLEEVEVYPTSSTTLSVDANPQNTFTYCGSLKRAVIKILYKIGHYFFRGCTALEEVSLGDVGVPVSTIGGLAFAGDTQTGLTITVYVSDDTARPLANSPWGATNATIIYRSSTTGEVLA